MIYISTTQQIAKDQVFALVQHHTNEPIRCFYLGQALKADLPREKPRAVFIFAPGETAKAVELQTYVRAIRPTCCVRILPTKRPTNRLLEPHWRKVVLKALKVPIKRLKAEAGQEGKQ